MYFKYLKNGQNNNAIFPDQISKSLDKNDRAVFEAPKAFIAILCDRNSGWQNYPVPFTATLQSVFLLSQQKQQLQATSLCHSLVPHTYVQL